VDKITTIAIIQIVPPGYHGSLGIMRPKTRGTAVSAGLISSRKTEMNISVVATGKPVGAGTMPESFPEFELPKTLRAAAITALDASHWAPLLAVSGHECVLL